MAPVDTLEICGGKEMLRSIELGYKLKGRDRAHSTHRDVDTVLIGRDVPVMASLATYYQSYLC